MSHDVQLYNMWCRGHVILLVILFVIITIIIYDESRGS